MPNNPPNLISTIAGALASGGQLIGPGGEVYSEWWEGSGVVLPAAVTTSFGTIQTQGCYGAMICEVRNLGANPFQGFLVNIKATPNSDFLPYLNGGMFGATTGNFTGLANFIYPTQVSLNSLAAGTNTAFAFNINGAWAVQFQANSLAGSTAQLLCSGRRFG